VIVVAVRWYLRFGLSYRDVEELLAERGVEVDHVTVYRRVQRFTPMLVEAARPCGHAVGERWFVDETYVKVGGVWRYVYRAVDQHGQVIDVYLSGRRNTEAARRFFDGALAEHCRPVEIVTDKPAGDRHSQRPPTGACDATEPQQRPSQHQSGTHTLGRQRKRPRLSVRMARHRVDGEG
jgi:transposase-like protein